MKGVVEFTDENANVHVTIYKEEYLYSFYLVWRSLKNFISSNCSSKHRRLRNISDEYKIQA